MADRSRTRKQEHIRDAHRWAFTIIAVACLLLTANVLVRLSSVTMTPPGASETLKARP